MTRPVRRRLLLAGLVVCALGELPAIARAQDPAAPAATAPPRNLLVRVQTALERVPLGYSVVAAPALGIERFTGAAGAVVIPIPSPGPVRLVIKRLGFTPRDTVVIVDEAVSQTVTVALARVSFRLEAVRVVAWHPCRRPGIARNAPLELRGIVDQLRQNAERYRLLTRTYPFVYTMQREFGQRAPDGSYIADSVDVIPVSGTPDWSYRPGRLIEREADTRQLVMRIPSISDLADDVFVDNHCFHVAGLEEKEGQRLLRLDIIAAERLRSVDANVVVWLDPHDYQLRHATFTLTKSPPEVAGQLVATSKVRYFELIPFVPVMDLMVAENILRRGRVQPETRTFVERQTIQALTYRGARPDALVADSLPRPEPNR
jgi:hypothetical protein